MSENKKMKRKKLAIGLGIAGSVVVVAPIITISAIKINFKNKKNQMIDLIKKYQIEFNNFLNINKELTDSISQFQNIGSTTIDFINKSNSNSEIHKKMTMLESRRVAIVELIVKHLRSSLNQKISKAEKLIDSESELEKYKSAYITFKNTIDNILNSLESTSTYLDISKKIDLFNKAFESLILDKEEIDFQIEKKNFVEKMENVKNTYLWLIDVIKDTEKIDLLKPLKTFIQNVNLENIKNNSALSSYKTKLNEILLSYRYIWRTKDSRNS
ncbi:hypothetical protein [[Mycoplasma] anseris]|uniref:Uncharacterized protein n=1 Tax=[Mycoplasma] anseris TaxID=92400 RepID=A0A2Z4NCW5_9BACT|nr:hypothetical protein [[Mycoplasma] anseris]AWX69408.1 hypothetical protein DP065_01400 [[Mycoplasma] anseris]